MNTLLSLIKVDYSRVISPYPGVHIMQEVPPLDVQELLAHLVRQSSPFLDQLGIRRGTHFLLNVSLSFMVILDCVPFLFHANIL